MRNALHDVVVVSLDVRIWSGRKQLRPEDLTASGRLPPKDLVSLGSKKLCDPKALRPFREIKRAAEARCQGIGVRFARAFAIPRPAAKTVLAELNDLAAQFRQARAAFVATYDAELARWKAQHPGYEHLIEAERLPQAAVLSKFVFGYELFAINSVDGDGELAALLEQGGAGSLVPGLVGTLYHEIARDAREFVRQSLTGRDEVSQKFLRPLRAIRQKLAGLAFLDPGIGPLVGSIDDALAAAPQKGRIDGASLAALRGVVMLLTDPARMRAHGRLVRGQGEPGGAPDAPVATEGPAEPPPEAPARAQRVRAFW